MYWVLKVIFNSLRGLKIQTVREKIKRLVDFKPHGWFIQVRYSHFKKYSRDVSLPKEAIVLYPFDWEDVTDKELHFSNQRCWFGLPSLNSPIISSFHIRLSRLYVFCHYFCCCVTPADLGLTSTTFLPTEWKTDQCISVWPCKQL